MNQSRVRGFERKSSPAEARSSAGGCETDADEAGVVSGLCKCIAVCETVASCGYAVGNTHTSRSNVFIPRSRLFSISLEFHRG